MAAYKLADGVYAIGVMNPNLRVFDIIMETKFGTTYNAYLIKGDDKTALIETVHEKFFDEYLENIQSVCDVSEIDYIIMNHCEPDHSGSIRMLLDMNPNIQVVASVPGAKYLTKITNSAALQTRAVKDGDNIDLGGRTLSFIAAPFLHWPDSIFTYSAADRMLFSCDFLGTHYCEPRPLDTHIKYPDDYDDAFENYYDAIFSPFKPFVLAGLEKIKDLAVDFVCTSHGPVLTEKIGEAKAKYREWSEPKPKEKTAVIAYVSAYGYTKMLADAAAGELKAAGFKTEMFNIIENDCCIVKHSIESADLVMFGTPTINRDALKPVWDMISSLDAITVKDKPCGVFGSYGWSGEGVPFVVGRLSGLKLKVYGDGFRANFRPSDDELEKMREYTKGLIG